MFERALAQMAKDFRAEAKAEGLAEGKAEGILEGQARLLLRQLALKFGPLDGATRAQVESAGPGQLTLRGERLLAAPTLAEVFAG